MYRLLTLVALAAFLPALAQAQPPLLGIVEEFCEEVERDAEDVQFELKGAVDELEDCARDFVDCQSGVIDRDPVSCISKYSRCTNNANQDQEQACGSFPERLDDAYDDALRRALFRGGAQLERRFQVWLVRRGEQCLAPAVATVTLCAGLTD